MNKAFLELRWETVVFLYSNKHSSPAQRGLGGSLRVVGVQET
jgi:hypothetical protein